MSDPSAVLEALRRREEKYRDLVEAVRDQRRLLEASDADGLLALVERKRTILGEIEALEGDLAEPRRDWPGWCSGLDPEARRSAEEIVAGTRRVLQELVRLEEEARGDAARPASASAFQGRRARAAYGRA